MVRVTTQQNHPFQKAEMLFDLKRLKADLEKYGKVTDAPWQYFLGILSGYSQREIADQVGKGENTVKQSLTQRLKDSLIELLDWPEDTQINWSRIPQQLISAGYGLSAQETHILLSQEILKNMLDKQRNLTANSLINTNFEASKLYGSDLVVVVVA